MSQIYFRWLDIVFGAWMTYRMKKIGCRGCASKICFCTFSNPLSINFLYRMVYIYIYIFYCTDDKDLMTLISLWIYINLVLFFWPKQQKFFFFTATFSFVNSCDKLDSKFCSILASSFISLLAPFMSNSELFLLRSIIFN